MNDYQTLRKTYYVYYHVDPRNDTVMYIGHGYKSRAWIHGNATGRGKSVPRRQKYIIRSQEHSHWLEEMDSLGYLPCDYVKIVYRGLLKTDACKDEQMRIRAIRPAFNICAGQFQLKISTEMLIKTQEYRADKVSYKEIGKRLRVSTMTAYRALNGKNKNECTEGDK